MQPLSEDVWNQLSTDDFNALAKEYETPFFLYELNILGDRIELIRNQFGNLIKVYFAVKSNPNLELLRAMLGTADGVDVSSGGELEQVKLAGFSAGMCSFAGPAKTRKELQFAIREGVGSISVESSRELLEIIDLSRQLKAKANIVVRVNPLLNTNAFGLKMGGKPLQFGIDEELLGDICRTIASNPQYLCFHGIHVYAGSQGFDVDGIAAGITDTLRIATQLESDTGLFCKKVNLGGGFGIAPDESRDDFDTGRLADLLLPAFRDFLSASRQSREIIFELGRYLTAKAGIYVTRVISEKHSRGKCFYLVDGGLNHHLAAAGSFGVGLRSNYILKNLSNPDGPVVRCHIAGPSCNPTDLFGVNVELATPSIGDLIAVMGAGSYGLTASPLLFLGHRTPAEVIRKDGQTFLGRPRHSILDFN